MWGRLNSFQRSMFQWNALHAYNAVHLVRVPVAPDLERLRQTIEHLLECKGLTHLTFDISHSRYTYEGGPAKADLKVISLSAPGAPLESELECQINTPFEIQPRMSPFRFFLAPEAEAFTLGLVYFHPVADAESIVYLLRDMVEAYLGCAAPEATAQLQLYPPSPDRWLWRKPRLLVRRWAAIPDSIGKLRRSCRIRGGAAHDLNAGVLLFSFEAADFARLRGCARAWGVTIHDLCLALLFKALSPLAPHRLQARRRALTLGTIVNVRPELALRSRENFGLFLGSFLVTHEVPQDVGIEALARDIHAQTTRSKAGRFYMGTAQELALARLLWRFLPAKRRAGFYQKAYPLYGGITNMNLDALWAEGPERYGINYLRVVSPGPITPLVLSLTTSGTVLNAGLSYRRAVFTRAEVEGARDTLVAMVREL